MYKYSFDSFEMLFDNDILNVIKLQGLDIFQVIIYQNNSILAINIFKLNSVAV